MLACVLLAVAAAPAASGEGLLSRPTAALVLQLSPAEVRAVARLAPTRQPVTVRPPVALTGRADWRERRAAVEQRARAWVRPDERYLYLLNSTFLC